MISRRVGDSGGAVEGVKVGSCCEGADENVRAESFEGADEGKCVRVGVGGCEGVDEGIRVGSCCEGADENVRVGSSEGAEDGGRV